MTSKQMRRAAFLLKDWAKVLRHSHICGDNVTWDDPKHEAEYEEHMALSRELYALAKKGAGL